MTMMMATMVLPPQRCRGRHRTLRSCWAVAAAVVVALQMHRLLGLHFQNLIQTFLFLLLLPMYSALMCHSSNLREPLTWGRTAVRGASEE